MEVDLARGFAILSERLANAAVRIAELDWADVGVPDEILLEVRSFKDRWKSSLDESRRSSWRDLAPEECLEDASRIIYWYHKVLELHDDSGEKAMPQPR